MKTILSAFIALAILVGAMPPASAEESAHLSTQGTRSATSRSLFRRCARADIFLGGNSRHRADRALKRTAGLRSHARQLRLTMGG